MTNSFKDRFKSYTNVKLLEIIENKNAYEAIAVETAQLELDSRHLTDQQLNEAKQPLEAKRQEMLKKKEKSAAFKNEAKSTASKILDNINPTIQKTQDKHIRIICAFLGIVWLYNLIANFQLLIDSLTSIRQRDLNDASFYLFFAPFILVPIASILFWFRKKIGWTLISIYLTFTFFTVLFSLIVDLKSSSIYVPAFDVLLPQTSPVVYAVQLLFFGGLLVVISKQSIRNIYSINKQRLFFTIGIVALLTTFQWWGLLT